MHVHIKHKPDPKFSSYLEEKFTAKFHISYGDHIPEPDSVKILVTGRPESIDLEQCTNLRSLIIPFAGIPEKTQIIMMKYPHITMHNLHHNALPTAENALALLLAASKYLIPPHNALANNDWRPRYAPNPSMLLYGKTVLLLGYGHIGQHLAKMLNAFEMEVMAIRNSINQKTKDQYAQIFPSSFLDDLLPKCDVLINTLPLTSKTNGLIGKNEFLLLRSGAIVVNIGRGKVFDQEAFFHALKSGHLSAAAIDVWYHYPKDEASRQNTKPADFPFWELDNVVLSPHRGGGLNSEETEYLRMEHLAHILNTAANGSPLPNKVNLEHGY